MYNSILTATNTIAGFLICMAAAAVLGVLTALVFMYKSRHSTSFAVTLALLPMAVAMVIMLVNGNIGTGVAVAGAFALVRFRSVPGTAKEIAAIFTAMAVGLAIGMGYVVMAAAFFAVIAVVTILLTMIRFGGAVHNEKQLKITIPENYNYEGLFDDLFEKHTREARLDRVKTTNMGTLFELTYTVVFPKDSIPKEFLDALRSRNGNLNISVGAVSEAETL